VIDFSTFGERVFHSDWGEKNFFLPSGEGIRNYGGILSVILDNHIDQATCYACSFHSHHI